MMRRGWEQSIAKPSKMEQRELSSCDQLDIYEGRKAQWLAQQSKQTSAEEKRFVVQNAFLGFFWLLSCHETCTVRCRVAHIFVFLTENMSPGLLPFCPKVKNLKHPSLHLISESIFTCLKHALGVSKSSWVQQMLPLPSPAKVCAHESETCEYFLYIWVTWTKAYLTGICARLDIY